MTHENSLANLKLGGNTKPRVKVQRTYTVLPTTDEWLRQRGNRQASQNLDEAIQKIINGESVGIQHLKKAEARISELEAENLRLKRLVGQFSLLSSQETLEAVEAKIRRLEETTQVNHQRDLGE